MTDSEIIKALENKVHGSDYACFEDYEILALIKRQKAENEALKELDKRLLKTARLERAEAYKEFAEKAAIELTNAYSSEYAHWIDNTLNNLLEELVGDDK